ncbi:mitochondrial enolase superfamily member 1 [Grus japonensis]|uniref:Mitochondrial enolase superfamily member 1 n=1 Tax=Grus japonensis TaxID=30415 RepID=A0ABC9VWM7_GRUJA
MVSRPDFLTMYNELTQVPVRGIVSKGDLTVGIYYQPPNQDNKTDEAIFGSLKQALGQQNLVLMSDFICPDICWKNNTAAHMSSIKFLECVEDCFLIQMLDVPTRNEALLDLLLKNEENLLCNISVSDSLGCSDLNIMEFGILLSMLKKGFFRYLNNKQKQKDNIGPLLNRSELVTSNAEKAEVLNTFFTSVFTSTVGPLALAIKIQVDANMDPLSVKEELVCKLLQELDPYKSMGPNNIHPSVLRELADITARLLSIIFEKSWRLGDIPEDWKKANVTPIYKKGLKEDPGNYKPIGFTSTPGKVMERILLGAVTSQVKHMIGKSQHGFTKATSCLTNLIIFYDKVTCSLDVEGAVDIVYLDFSNTFDTVPLIVDKLMCYGLDKWSVWWVGTG